MVAGQVKEFRVGNEVVGFGCGLKDMTVVLWIMDDCGLKDMTVVLLIMDDCGFINYG